MIKKTTTTNPSSINVHNPVRNLRHKINKISSTYLNYLGCKIIQVGIYISSPHFSALLIYPPPFTFHTSFLEFAVMRLHFSNLCSNKTSFGVFIKTFCYQFCLKETTFLFQGVQRGQEFISFGSKVNSNEFVVNFFCRNIYLEFKLYNLC